MVLVCEFGMMSGDHTLAFQLLGCIHRLVKLMGLEDIDIESSDKPKDITWRECTRRLVWSSFLLDTMVASGIEDLESWRACPQIPLPVPEHDFVAQTTSASTQLPTVDAFLDDNESRLLPMRSHIIHLIRLRRSVLR